MELYFGIVFAIRFHFWKVLGINWFTMPFRDKVEDTFPNEIWKWNCILESYFRFLRRLWYFSTRRSRAHFHCYCHLSRSKLGSGDDEKSYSNDHHHHHHHHHHKKEDGFEDCPLFPVVANGGGVGNGDVIVTDEFCRRASVSL